MIIAILSTSKSRSAKISAQLRNALSDGNTLTAGFRYPVSQVAKMLGWDSNYDAKGKKLINAIYNAALEYDRNFFIDKMERFLKKNSNRKTIIITDVEDQRQVQMLRRLDTLKMIVCGDNDTMLGQGLINVYVESERPVEDVVAEIIREVHAHSTGHRNNRIG